MHKAFIEEGKSFLDIPSCPASSSSSSSAGGRGIGAFFSSGKDSDCRFSQEDYQKFLDPAGEQKNTHKIIK